MDGNETVSYCAKTDSVTCYGIDRHDGTGDAMYWDDWKTRPTVVTEYYPYYVNSVRHEDTYEKAFNIAKLLLKKKLLKSRKLKDFVGLVDEIAKEL